MMTATRYPMSEPELHLSSFPPAGIAVVFGATGGVGSALVQVLEKAGHFSSVLGLSRSTSEPFDLLDEGSIAAACTRAAGAGEIRLAIDATGFLHDDRQKPEKMLREITAENLSRSFALNAIGPALLMKHLLPLLPRAGKSVFATLSARVGSIGDNRLGGWYAYRASKAALNQLLVTASIELRRKNPSAICLALHPGTVAPDLSAPFSKDGLELQSPVTAATRLLNVIEMAKAAQTGHFLDHHGHAIPW